MGTFQWASTKCFLTWNAKATPAGRLLFQLSPSMPRTDATGFGLWPTARTTGLDGGSNSRKAAKARGMWPTPTARDHKSGAGKTQEERGRNTGPTLSQEAGGSLNPQWVEWLQGYPSGWTDLRD